MTGFARVRRMLPANELILSIKSVNHRGLDMHFHMPPELAPFEGVIRTVIKSKIARGHLQVHVTLNRTAGGNGSNLNRAMLESYLHAFAEAARVFGLDSKPDLNAALRVPGMF